MGKIYILLPVHNRLEITRRFISCLKKQFYESYHLVLIDDGSDDGTEEMVRGEISALSVLKGHGNWWWAGSLQRGFEWLKTQPVCGTDLVLIINDDTEFEPDFLERAVHYMVGLDRTLLLSKSYGRQTGQLIADGFYLDWRLLSFSPANFPEAMNCFSTRGLFLNVETFFNIGGFFPRLLPHYLSDYEFTLRAHRLGMNLTMSDNLKLVVDEKTTGVKEYSGLRFRPFIKTYFAKNSKANPFAWTAFIALACPWQWKLLNWMRVWYGTTKHTLRAMFCR